MRCGAAYWTELGCVESELRAQAAQLSATTPPDVSTNRPLTTTTTPTTTPTTASATAQTATGVPAAAAAAGFGGGAHASSGGGGQGGMEMGEVAHLLFTAGAEDEKQ